MVSRLPSCSDSSRRRQGMFLNSKRWRGGCTPGPCSGCCHLRAITRPCARTPLVRISQLTAAESGNVHRNSGQRAWAGAGWHAGVHFARTIAPLRPDVRQEGPRTAAQPILFLHAPRPATVPSTNPAEFRGTRRSPTSRRRQIPRCRMNTRLFR